MPKMAHPFTHHLARWKEAQKRLPAAHEQAKDEAVGHIHRAVVAAAQKAPGMDPKHVGAYWYRGNAHVVIEPGSETERLEYGDLDNAPQATIRNTANRALHPAGAIYRQTLKKELGF